MRKILSLTIALLVMFLFMATGCKKRTPDTEETLEIYAWDAGYGATWIHALVADFENQDWVKEKYPNLITAVKSNDRESYAVEQIKSDRTTIDLFFTSSTSSLFGASIGGNSLLEEISDVYDADVLGENIKVSAKLNSNLTEFIDFYDKATDTTKKYFLPWAATMGGILYNVDLLERFKIDVPLTTDQLIDAMRVITVAKNKGDYNGNAVVTSVITNYWEFMLRTWWAQYDGYDGYINFYEGIDDRGRLSPGIFNREGIYASLRVIEEIFGTKDFVTQDSNALTFMQSQTRFLQGDAVFNVNGDWFTSEMESVKKGLVSKGVPNYNIQFMKAPIVSEIINETASIPNEQTLIEVIKAIDRGETTYGDVQPKDFAKIYEARNIVDSLTLGHHSVIPSYANGKAVAKDFLIYMATDNALSLYSKNTSGASIPFDYDVKEKDSEHYNSTSNIQKSRLEIMGSNDVRILPPKQSFRLSYLGGLTPLATVNDRIEVIFLNKRKVVDGAGGIKETEIKYWNASRWNNIIISAGLA